MDIILPEYNSIIVSLRQKQFILQGRKTSLGMLRPAVR
jgi:hypothetical protein